MQRDFGPPPVADLPLVHAAPARIMAVDDMPFNLDLLARILQAEGHQVLQFPDGAMALRAAAADPPDLILLDIMMPGLNGFEVCQRLKADARLSAIPVIFISALQEIDQIVRAYAEGAVDYITKPFQREEIVARVTTHLGYVRMRRALQTQQTLLEEQVRERTEDLREAQRVARIGSWRLDLRTRQMICSEETYRLFGLPACSVVRPEDLLARVHPDDRTTVEEAWQSALRQRQYAVEHRMLVNDTLLWVRQQAEFRYDEDDVPVRVLGTVRDITIRKLYEQQLLEEQHRLQTALEAAGAGIWEWEVAGDQIRCDDHWARAIGLDVAQLPTTRTELWSRYVHPEDLDLVRASLDRHLQESAETFSIEYRLQHQLGHWVWVRSLGRVMRWSRDGQPTLMTGIDIDISQERRHQEQLEYLEHYDGLTGLLNRRLFIQLLNATMLAYANVQERMALVCIDLDGFAHINQHWGHEVGNRVLVTLSQRLLDSVRERQHVARLGGDEFALILTGLKQPGSCIPPVLRLLDVLAQPVVVDGHSIAVSASIGMSVYPQVQHLDAEQFLRQADQAMYQAKLAGKNRYQLFDSEHDAQARERFILLDEIRRGIAQDEFVLHYQPKVNMRCGTLSGFEALIRWQHPQRGLLFPGHFIPLLGEHPLSIQLGQWVIDAALRQLDDWQSQGLLTRVSVNVDGVQLHDPEFIDSLQRILSTYPRIRPQQLSLEILETGALQDMAAVSEVIAQLQAMGIEVALDDFGTGYSSLTFLKRLAARTVKIDQSFVRFMLEDGEQAVIVDSILALARNFNREVIAEGVETEAQGRLLLELGCECGQGYGIARPMPAEAVLPWVRSWSPPQSWREVQAVNIEQIPLVLAELDHHIWLREVFAYLADEKHQAPPSSSATCRYGRWLERPDTRQRFQDKEPFQRLVRQHEQIHALTDQLLRRHAAGALSAGELAPARQELQALSEHLTQALRELFSHV